MDIMITGGNGLLGRHLVCALNLRGDRVRVLVLPTEDTRWLREHGVAIHDGDILRPETLTASMRGAGAVLHLADLVGVRQPMTDHYAINVTGTENVCRAALTEGVSRIIHVSSWTVYGVSLGKPVREDFLLKPFSEPYSMTKAAGDLAVQRMIVDEHLPAVIIRPGAIFGPGDRLLFSQIADRLAAGKSFIVGSGDNALPLVYVTDVVQGLLLALEHEHAVGQAYNISNDSPLTQQQFLNAVAHEVGAAVPRIHVPYHGLYPAGYLAEHVARLVKAPRQPAVTRMGVKFLGTDNRHAIDKARRELGYVPQVGLREGVRIAAAWYRAEGQNPIRLRRPPSPEVAVLPGVRTDWPSGVRASERPISQESLSRAHELRRSFESPKIAE
jgi:nucleoside-diphosphate-sugar epimerase